MATRIDTMPVYAARLDQIDPALYNLWRRLKLHRPMPLRIELPEMKSMALIVEQDDWVLVDPRQYDLPILAWVKFQDHGRSSLHTPVACTLNYYHYMASRWRSRLLVLMEQYFEEYLLKIDKH